MDKAGGDAQLYGHALSAAARQPTGRVAGRDLVVKAR